MEKFFVVVITMGLLVLPSVNHGQSEQAASGSPPIAQPLIREGDFASRLAEGLRIGSPASEPEAESMLSSLGIVPEKGWIADYPVTPVTISELRSAVAGAADSNQLPMTRDEALEAFENIIGELGLAVASETSGQQGSGESLKDDSDYVAPGVVNNYYYNRGPPVVTYYLPPPSYYYLYSWVPHPFWHSGFFFGGFFILRDFNKVIIVDRKKSVVSNRFFHPKSRRHFALDPDKRFRRYPRVPSFRSKGEGRLRSGFRSPAERRDARSILNRSLGRHPTRPGTSPPAQEFLRPGGTLGRGSPTGRTPVLDRRQGRSGQSSTIDRAWNLSARREKARIRKDGTFESRSFLRPQGRRGNHRAFNAPPRGGPSRAFRAPSSRTERGFARGSVGRSGGHRTFSRGFTGRNRGEGFSTRGGGGRGGACKGRC